METTVSQRVIMVMKYLKFDPEKDNARFSREIGLKRPDNLYNLLNEKTNKSSNVLELISKRFENISLEWMLYGRGEMLKSGVNEEVVEEFKPPSILELQQKIEKLLLEVNTEQKKRIADKDKIIELQTKIDELKDKYERKAGGE